LKSHTHSGTLSFRGSFQQADFLGRIGLVLSTWFCAGLMPKAPGTFGTMAAVPVALFMRHLGEIHGLLFAVFFICVSLWASGASRKLLEGEDPSEIVIDEVAGFLVTMSFISWSWSTLISGFFLFRAFDILKPFPIRRLERLGGGAGIVLDDIMAGVYANLCLRVITSYAG